MAVSLNNHISPDQYTRRYSESDTQPPRPDTLPLNRTHTDSELTSKRRDEIRREQGNLRAGFMRRLSGLSPQGKKLADEMPLPAAIEMRELWAQRLDSALLALQRNRGEFMGGGEELEGKLLDLASQIHANQLPAGMHKNFEKKVIELMAEHMYTQDLGPGEKEGAKHAKKRAQNLLKPAVTQNLNERPWEKIETSFRHAGRIFKTVMKPAAQMKLGNKDIFETGYGGQGISSGSTKEKKHAVNLWSTTFTIAGPDGREITIVNAIRHGINSAYGLKGKKNRQEREQAALERSKEVITAALSQTKGAELRRAQRTGQPIELKLTSTSLVTPVDVKIGSKVFSLEGSQMKDQVNAWNKLTEMSRANNGIELTVNDENDEPQTVKVKLETSALNFGVNPSALTRKIPGLTGWSAADKANEAGLKKLLGDDLSPESTQGWAAEYLANNPHAPNRALVEELRNQICEIWETKSHRRNKHVDANGNESPLGDPYKMAARVIFLAQEIGAAPCYNCKSGKDRTAVVDCEVKYLAAQWHLNGKLPKPGAEMSREDRALYHQILLNTGNGEIQKKNTGAPGNKAFKKMLFGDPLLKDRVGDPKVFNAVMGLSKFVKS